MGIIQTRRLPAGLSESKRRSDSHQRGRDHRSHSHGAYSWTVPPAAAYGIRVKMPFGYLSVLEP
jgi:hypothetical protein